ncbi:MAG: RNA polymerase sigma factor [Candidatus Hydrogenedentes bacterium]|nr:RNA polymerase sigma factor [Candidatus Hydrogenedentota bacterium]
MSDAEAIQAVRNGDKDRYAELVHRYQRMVYAIAWSRLGDRDLCEDAAQETFVKAYRYLMALRNPAKFPGWLARIAQNVSTSILRCRKRELDKRERWRLEQPEPATNRDVPDDAPLSETLRETLAELPDQHRECLVLYYLEGKSVRDAAELLSISESTMKTRLHRARQALRGRLEEKLEDSLAALGPRKNFSAGVIALLPSSPWLAGAGVGGASIGSKLLTGLAQFTLLPMVLFMSLFNVAFAALFFGWLGKLESANLAPGPGQRARQQVIRRNVLLLVVAGARAIFFSFSFSFRGNPVMVFQLLVPLCAWGTYRTLRFLRVNRTPFAYGQVLANATFTLTSLLIGFLHAPFWIFFVAMLPLNVVLYYANKSRPARHDYNLFLRAAQGMLGIVEERRASTPHATTTELRAFARFLGGRFLVLDYTIREGSLRLHLPPVKPALRQYFGFNGSNSTVLLRPGGRAEAQLGERDRKNLATTIESPLREITELEATVSGAVSEALHLFMDGQTAQAEVLLQSEGDAAIFRKPVGDSAEHRARGILAIVAAVFLLAFSLFAAFWQLPPPIRMTRDHVNEAIVAWGNDYDRRWVAFHTIVTADAPLPLDALAAPARAAYRNAAIQILTEGRVDADGRATNALFGAETLYNVIQSKLLSDSELASLGIDSKTVRQALTGTNQVRLDHLFILWNEAEGAYVYPGSVMTIARRLACLKHFGCLDLVDSDRLAQQLADRQVTPAWELRDESLDWKRAQGLFLFMFCDRVGTFGTRAARVEVARLDLIDREACIEGILRFHNGRGEFGSLWQRDDEIRIYPSTKANAVYAMESLRILNALDRIPDFTRWNLKPEIIVTDRNQPIADNISTPDAIRTWACQKRMELVRATYQLPQHEWRPPPVSPRLTDETRARESRVSSTTRPARM